MRSNGLGDVAGADAVLCFITPSGPDAPLKKLFGFDKVFLEPGRERNEKKRVTCRAISSNFL